MSSYASMATQWCFIRQKSAGDHLKFGMRGFLYYRTLCIPVAGFQDAHDLRYPILYVNSLAVFQFLDVNLDSPAGSIYLMLCK